MVQAGSEGIREGRHTANKVLSSIRPTAAIRRFPLTNKYPMIKIDNADNTIRAGRQLTFLLLPKGR
jgi:hypothetical protein